MGTIAGVGSVALVVPGEIVLVAVVMISVVPGAVVLVAGVMI